MTASYQAVVNQPFPSRPTGELGVMTELGNPIPYPIGPGVAISGNYSGGAYQQINVGDIMVLYSDPNSGGGLAGVTTMIAVPACVINSATTYASNSAASKVMLQLIHGNAVEPGTAGSANTPYGFLGLSMSYRDPNNPSTGKSSDRISIAPRGRAKMRVIPGDANFGNYLPAGTLIGCAVNSLSTASGSFTSSAVPGYVQTSQAAASSTNVGGNTYAGTTAAGTTTPLTASEAIGRLAFDKQASDTFVWVDFVSTILEGGVQNTNVST